MTVPDGRADVVEVAFEDPAVGTDAKVLNVVGKPPLGTTPVGKTPVERAGAVVDELVNMAPADFVYSGWPDAVVKVLVERTIPLEVAMISADFVESGRPVPTEPDGT